VGPFINEAQGRLGFMRFFWVLKFEFITRTSRWIVLVRSIHLKFYVSLRIIFSIIIIYNCYFYYVNLEKKTLKKNTKKKQVKNKTQTLILLLTYHSIIKFNIKPKQNDQTNPSNSM
jgi:hypothetical protein